MTIRRRDFLKLSLAIPAFALPTLGQQRGVYLSVNPAKVNSGDTVTVQWDAGSATEVYLLGLGQVAVKGQMSIRISTSTAVTLVATTSAGIVCQTTTVSIAGAKGAEDTFEQNLGAFQYEYVSKLQQPIGKLADLIVTCIQSKLNAVQRSLPQPSGAFQIESTRFPAPGLQANMPRAYFGRRISYLIGLPAVANPSTPGVTAISIKSLIEYKRISEPTWYAESDQALYIQQALVLEQLLKGSA